MEHGVVTPKRGMWITTTNNHNNYKADGWADFDFRFLLIKVLYFQCPTMDGWFGGEKAIWWWFDDVFCFWLIGGGYNNKIYNGLTVSSTLMWTPGYLYLPVYHQWSVPRDIVDSTQHSGGQNIWSITINIKTRSKCAFPKHICSHYNEVFIASYNTQIVILVNQS